ncbi:hypothetical protein [Thioalkalivibrio sp. AKL12]|uniref:hypothetical protein n=1 Tax=Thioalkalivibrio sp. AKL12 TaxID=1158159 RepID=UPI00035E05BF
MLAVPQWIGIWWSATGFRLMRHNRLLALPVLLRHVQSIGLNFGLFLCVAGIVVLLQDLLRHGDAEVSLLGGMHDVPRSGTASADRDHGKS